MPFSAGQRLGPYEVLSAVGMGEVYRARDTRLGRTVAIKVLSGHLSDKPELRERFEREVHAVANLNHPHISVLYDIGREGDTDYIVIEYLEGETLAARLTKGPLPLAQALDIAAHVADALDAAHRQGITHRDLKPANIMLTKSGAKLLDFGVAKLNWASDGGGATAVPTVCEATRAGMLVGTVHYMAPEQLEGKPVDGRTDIYALGAVIHEMGGRNQSNLLAGPPDDRVFRRRKTQEDSDRRGSRHHHYQWSGLYRPSVGWRKHLLQRHARRPTAAGRGNGRRAAYDPRGVWGRRVIALIPGTRSGVRLLTGVRTVRRWPHRCSHS